MEAHSETDCDLGRRIWSLMVAFVKTRRRPWIILCPKPFVNKHYKIYVFQNVETGNIFLFLFLPHFHLNWIFLKVSGRHRNIRKMQTSCCLPRIRLRFIVTPQKTFEPSSSRLFASQEEAVYFLFRKIHSQEKQTNPLFFPARDSALISVFSKPDAERKSKPINDLLLNISQSA